MSKIQDRKKGGNTMRQRKQFLTWILCVVVFFAFFQEHGNVLLAESMPYSVMAANAQDGESAQTEAEGGNENSSADSGKGEESASEEEGSDGSGSSESSKETEDSGGGNGKEEHGGTEESGGSKNDGETEIGTETGTETETGSGTDAETETEMQTETVIEAETETGTETETETMTETEPALLEADVETTASGTTYTVTTQAQMTAVAAVVKDGDTIRLGANFGSSYGTGTFGVRLDKKLVFDMNGYNFCNGGSVATITLWVHKGGDVQLINSRSGGGRLEGGMALVAVGKVTVENGVTCVANLNNTMRGGAIAAVATSGSELVLNGGTFAGAASGKGRIQIEGTAYFNGGSYQVETIQIKGKATFENITCTSSNVQVETNGSLQINRGYYNPAKFTKVSGSTIQVSGGYFTANPASYSAISIDKEQFHVISTGNSTYPYRVVAKDAYVSSKEGDDTSGTGTKEYPYQTILAAYQNVQDGGTIYIMEDMIQTKTTPFSLDKKVIVQGDGGVKNIRMGGVGFVCMNVGRGEVTFRNLTFDGRKASYPNQRTPLLYVGNSATMTLGQGVTVKDFKTTYLGAVTAWTGNLNIQEGAVIKDNQVEKGTVTIVKQGTLRMTGGEIYGNENTKSIGSAGILITDQVDVVISGGMIRNNKTTASGGATGIRALNASTVELSGNVQIRDNVNMADTAPSDVAGVHIDQSSKLTVKDRAEITNNKVTGGGVNIDSNLRSDSIVTVDDTFSGSIGFFREGTLQAMQCSSEAAAQKALQYFTNDVPGISLLYQNGSGLFTDLTRAVSGDIYCRNLYDAVAAVPVNGVQTKIQMLADSAETQTSSVKSEQNVVLDLNGFHVSMTNNNIDLLETGGTLVIQDGSEKTVNGRTVSKGRMTGGNHCIKVTGGSFKVAGGYIGKPRNDAISVESGGTPCQFLIQGGILEGNNYAICDYSNAGVKNDFRIDAGTLISHNSYHVVGTYAGGNVGSRWQINGGFYKNTANADLIFGNRSTGKLSVVYPEGWMLSEPVYEAAQKYHDGTQEVAYADCHMVRSEGFYVSASGNDTTGYGTPERPYATMLRAMTMAPNQGTVYLMSDMIIKTVQYWNQDKTLLITSCDENGIPVERAEDAHQMKRAAGMNLGMYSISKGRLTFRNIILDGGAVWKGGMSAADALIQAAPAAAATTANTGVVAQSRTGQILHIGVGVEVTLDSGAVLQNNDVAYYPGNTGTPMDCGGGVYLAGTLHLKEGSAIRNCAVRGTFAADGGAISTYEYASAVVNMSGGEITGCYGERMGSALRINKGRFIMSGGSITGNRVRSSAPEKSAVCYYNNPVAMQISKNAVIAGNTDQNGNACNLYKLSSGAKIQIAEDFTGKLSVNVPAGERFAACYDAAGNESQSVAEQVRARVHSDRTGYSIFADGALLYPGIAAARIGEKEYQTLVSAVQAVPANQLPATVQMIANSAESSRVQVLAGQNIILDLNGKTVTQSAGAAMVEGELTIRDTTSTTADGVTRHYGKLNGSTALEIMSGGRVTVESGHLTGTVNDGISLNAGTSRVEIRGGIIQGVNYAICDYTLQDAGAELRITGGTLLATGAMYVVGTYSDHCGGTWQVSGGYYKNSKTEANIFGNRNAAGTLQAVYPEGYALTTVPEFTSADATTTAAAYLKCHTVRLNDYYVSSAGNDTSGVGTATSPYATIAKAYSMVQSGGHIYIMDDVSVSAAHTLGNKDVIIASSDRAGAAGAARNKLILATTANAFLIEGGSNVTFSNLDITQAGNLSQSGGVFALAGSQSTLVLENVRISSIIGSRAVGSVIHAQTGTKLIGKDGIVIEKSTSTRAAGSHDIAAVVLEAGAAAQLSGTVLIQDNLCGNLYLKGEKQLELTGALTQNAYIGIAALLDRVVFAAAGSEQHLKQDMPAFVADDLSHIVLDTSADGVFELSLSRVEAQIKRQDGIVLFATLEEAVAAAESGETITLLLDVELEAGANPVSESSVNLTDKSVILDLAGHTVKQTSGRSPVFSVYDTGSLTICGEGSLSGGSTTLYAANNGIIMMQGDVNVEGMAYFAAHAVSGAAILIEEGRYTSAGNNSIFWTSDDSSIQLSGGYYTKNPLNGGATLLPDRYVLDSGIATWIYKVDYRGYYVAADGSDTTGTGSKTQPYATIAKAYEELTTVKLSTGELIPNGTFEDNMSGWSSAAGSISRIGHSYPVLSNGDAYALRLRSTGKGALASYTTGVCTAGEPVKLNFMYRSSKTTTANYSIFMQASIDDADGKRLLTETKTYTNGTTGGWKTVSVSFTPAYDTPLHLNILFMSSSGSTSYTEDYFIDNVSLTGKGVGALPEENTIVLLSDIIQQDCIVFDRENRDFALASAGSANYSVTRAAGADGDLFTLSSGSLELKNVTVDGGQRRQSGSLFCVNEADAALYLTEGTFLKNNDTAGNGGGIHMKKGTMEMQGGAITGNRASYGGGVYVESGAAVMLKGTPRIVSNYGTEGNTENNLFLPEGVTLTQTGDLSEGAQVGISHPKIVLGETVFGVNREGYQGEDCYYADGNYSLNAQQTQQKLIWQSGLVILPEAGLNRIIIVVFAVCSLVLLFGLLGLLWYLCHKRKTLRRFITALMAGMLVFALAAVAAYAGNRKQERRAEEAVEEVLNAGLSLPGDGREYSGILEIPVLDLRLPVLAVYTEANMKLMPCSYKGRVEDDNLIIVGHNYSRHFGLLEQLEAGDEIVFTDTGNQRCRYRVTKLETLEETDVDGMVAGEWDLTLFTCTYNSSRRLTVRCEKLD